MNEQEKRAAVTPLTAVQLTVMPNSQILRHLESLASRLTPETPEDEITDLLDQVTVLLPAERILELWNIVGQPDYHNTIVISCILVAKTCQAMNMGIDCD